MSATETTTRKTQTTTLIQAVDRVTIAAQNALELAEANEMKGEAAALAAALGEVLEARRRAAVRLSNIRSMD